MPYLETINTTLIQLKVREFPMHKFYITFFLCPIVTPLEHVKNVQNFNNELFFQRTLKLKLTVGRKKVFNFVEVILIEKMSTC